MKMLAVDPGGVHVGMARFTLSGATNWECTDAFECEDPEQAIDLIAAFMLNYHIDVLVVEEFRLYPDKAMAQTGSTMPTCELIGQIKWAHRLDSRRRRDAEQVEVELVLQPAAIQEPTAAVLRNRGIKSTAVREGAGGHAKSAELHGWHWILRGKERNAGTTPARRAARRK